MSSIRYDVQKRNICVGFEILMTVTKEEERNLEKQVANPT
jgi:hypothetical protein